MRGTDDVGPLFSLIGVLLDLLVVAYIVFMERSNARKNNRPMRRWVVITCSIFFAVGIALAITRVVLSV